MKSGLYLCVALVIFSSFGISYSLKNGDGVCNRTEMRNVSKDEDTEVVIGTTEVPCHVNSWIDELSCMNRKTKTRNVTEIRKIIKQVLEPVVIKICCDGYVQINDECHFITTSQVITTRQQTESNQEDKATTQLETTTWHDVDTTVSTAQQTSVGSETTKKESKPITTTYREEMTKTESKQEYKAMTQLETTTLHDVDTTVSTAQQTTIGSETTKKVSKPRTTTYKAEMSKSTHARSVIDTTEKINSKIVDETNIIPGKDDNNVDSKDILLYISASCGLISIIVSIAVIGYCYHRNQKNKNRSHTAVLTMDTIEMKRNSKISNSQHGTNSAARNENAKNAYTELHMCGAYTYDDLIGVEEENPYEELPDDYQDCEAPSRLSKTSHDHYYDVSKF